MINNKIDRQMVFLLAYTNKNIGIVKSKFLLYNIKGKNTLQ